jgi:thiol-disulfide isomerase/thioredoxin
VSGGTWIASYVLLWAAVGVLGLAVVVLLRQIGVLHARLRPQGVHPANEGPVQDAPAPSVGGFAFDDAAVTLVAFTSPTCTLCAALLPSLHALEEQYPDVALRVVSHGPDTVGIFRAYQVTSTPYVVAVDGSGTVRGGGVANTLEQVEVLLESVS